MLHNLCTGICLIQLAYIKDIKTSSPRDYEVKRGSDNTYICTSINPPNAPIQTGQIRLRSRTSRDREKGGKTGNRHRRSDVWKNNI